MCIRDRLQAALEVGEETLAGRRKTLGPDHPDTIASMKGLASTLRALGDAETALELEEEWSKLAGTPSPHPGSQVSEL